MQIALENGAQAIVPGYGFLSENMQFAESVEAADLVFVGPTPLTINEFGLKHTARELAIKAGVPVVPGSQTLLDSLAAAVENAHSIGFPVMLKATAGGGGMGLVVCHDEKELRQQFEAIRARSQTLFKESGVFLERYFPSSHHIEVQIFGNGLGQVVSIGERECSIQRRHQKVVEECPSPFVQLHYPDLRQQLTECAIRLGSSVNYRSAGTVEYLVDDNNGEFYFLEMNTRLQVEHGISELCYNVDLVELMYRQADSQLSGTGGISSEYLKHLQERLQVPQGHAIEVRLCAENPARNFTPSTGILQQVSWSKIKGTRIDTWIRAGNVIGPEYDSLLAKIMQWSPSRQEAIAGLQCVVSKTVICGPTLNLDFLLSIMHDARFQSGETTTDLLTKFTYVPSAIDVVSGGALTLVQQYPGRPAAGHGFAHSGPMDPIASRIANLLVNNEPEVENLEITLSGPELHFKSAAYIALCGPDVTALLDENEFPLWTRVRVNAGQRLKIGQMATGCRVYLAVHGGFPGIGTWFGSKATTPGLQIGGYQGRALRTGDLLAIVKSEGHEEEAEATKQWSISTHLRPKYSDVWTLRAMPGPYETGYMSSKDIESIYSQPWEISHNAARSGIRLITPDSGPPEFARLNGGDGGDHPSNVIEYGYPVGGLNWTGSEAVLFPLDCPDFGGFVCSMTVVKSDWWKLGQIRPGNRVRFQRIDLEKAIQCRKKNEDFITAIATALQTREWHQVLPLEDEMSTVTQHQDGADIVRTLEKSTSRPPITYRAAGDCYLLIDYGVGDADLNLKCRAAALRSLLVDDAKASGQIKAEILNHIINVVSCGNSLMIHFESLSLARETLVDHLVQVEDFLDSKHISTIPNRRFRLPIVFSHQKLDDMMHRYMVNQRDLATYLPDPLEFVARNNAITTDELKKIVLSLELVVIGVGFLMALPQCLPLDLRHRLNVPKMNPSRVFTPAGTVSWGGNAIAIYAEDSPGGYMPIGLTIPGVDKYGFKEGFSPERPWMFEDMDIITFYEVTSEEYEKAMAQFNAGSYSFEYSHDSFSMRHHDKLLIETAMDVQQMKVSKASRQSEMSELEKTLYKQWDAARRAKGSSQDDREMATNGTYSTQLQTRLQND